MKIRIRRRALTGIAAAVALILSIATAAHAVSPGEEIVSRLIVKPRARTGAGLARSLRAFDATGLSKTAKVPMKVYRPMSGDAHVIRLDRPVTLSEARVISERLMRNDGRIEFAEPDRRVRRFATTPTDPAYLPYQWHYFAPAGSNLGGANLPDAWDVTKGSASVVAAVIDTGYRQHADLATVLPGYDLISDNTIANDGDGRDSDAQDPGDWVAAGECGSGQPAEDSSWHGTHVAGTIAALMNNGIYGTGIAPNVKILPVRVLGKCGGWMSDVVDGMRWAAGLSVPGVPANPNPADVMNLSLGSSGSCSTTEQNAATEIVNAGKVIVAATGNDGTTTVGAPANCTGVIAVTAHTSSGLRPSWATVGTRTTISGPGGSPGVYSLLNTGTKGPVADTYALYQGTSMATPHVTGVVALMLSVKSLTPAQVKSYLRSSARPFPAGSYCATSGGLCGAGLLDATGALSGIVVLPTVEITTPSQVVAPNTTVSLSGSATAESPKTIASYLWTQLTGPSTVVLTNANSANATFTSPATGVYSFQLAATDNAGLPGTAIATVRVNSAPVLTSVPAKTVSAGNTLNFTVGATDVDGDTPIFHSISLPTGAALSAQGAFSWPNASPTGGYTMTYYASDPYGGYSDNGSVDITVTAGNSAPVLIPVGAKTVVDKHPLNFTVTATDVDGDTLTFHPVSLPTGSTLSAQGAFSWPTATPVGSHAMTYYASDAYASSPTGTVDITVTVNSAPALTAIGTQTVTVGYPLDFTVGATDVNGDTPIFHSISLPTGATLSVHGDFSWPVATPVGNYTMTYNASDGYGATSATGTVYITVAEVPPPPPPPDTGGGGSTGSSSGGGGGCMEIGGSGGVPPGDASPVSIGILLLPAAALGLRRTFRGKERAVRFRHPSC